MAVSPYIPQMPPEFPARQYRVSHGFRVWGRGCFYTNRGRETNLGCGDISPLYKYSPSGDELSGWVGDREGVEWKCFTGKWIQLKIKDGCGSKLSIGVSDRSDLYFNKCFALVSSASSWNEQCRTAAVIVVTDGVIDRRRGNVNGALWLKVASICPSVCFGAIQLN